LSLKMETADCCARFLCACSAVEQQSNAIRKTKFFFIEDRYRQVGIDTFGSNINITLNFITGKYLEMSLILQLNSGTEL
jgi:hypothetical protein